MRALLGAIGLLPPAQAITNTELRTRFDATGRARPPVPPSHMW